MDLFTIFSIYLLDPKSYVEGMILIVLFRNTLKINSIQQWIKDRS